MANVRLIAKLAGVSPSTVSRVITGKAAVKHETRQKVLQAIVETNYEARKATQKVSLSVGIVMPKHSANNLSGHPSFSSATAMFIDVMAKQNIKNEIVVFDDHQLNNPDTLFPERLQGFFILGTSENEEVAILQYMKNHHRPYIFLNRWFQESYINYVNVNDIKAATCAVRYLINQGHRSIAFVGGNANFQNSKLRIQGYQQALREYGIEPNSSFLFQGTYTEHYGYIFAEQFLRLKEKPTAALFASDMIAIGFINHGRELGIEVPRDISLIGWGDFNLSAYVQPALTTVHVPSAELGAQAARMLINLMTTKDLLMIQALIDAHLVVRDTVRKFDS